MQSNSNESSQEDQPIERKSLYGLDFELLKQLNLDSMLEDQNSEEQRQSASSQIKVVKLKKKSEKAAFVEEQ